MPPKIIGLACAAAMLCTSIAGAQVDFGSLLNTIGFGDDDPPSVNQAEDLLPTPSDEAGTDPLDALGQPGATGDLPAEQTLPNLPQPAELLPSPGVPSVPAPPAAQVFNEPVREIPQSPLQRDPLLPQGTPTPLEDLREIPSTGSGIVSQPPSLVPAPEYSLAPAPVAQPIDEIDFDALTGPASGCDCGGSVCERGCDANPYLAAAGRARVVKTVACLDKPNLPPPANAEQMFATPRCYNDLWGNYAAEKAAECRCHHRHIHGTCDCLERSQSRNCGPKCGTTCGPTCGQSGAACVSQ